MNRRLIFLSIFVLVGAGCSTTAPLDDSPLDAQVSEPLPMQDEGPTEVEVFVSDPAIEDEQIIDEKGVLQIELISENYSFTPQAMSVFAGQEVRVVFAENTGVHTFAIDEIGLSVPINEGDETTFTAPSEPGAYSYYCSIGNHRELGMEGVLIVTE